MPGRYSRWAFELLYRAKISGQGDSSAAVTLALPRVKPGWYRHLTHVTVLNKTNAYDLVRLSTFDGAIHFNIDELTSPAANELAVAKEDILLQEGDSLHAILTGTTDGDILEMVAIGWDSKLR
jgi:hypothetical protein